MRIRTQFIITMLLFGMVMVIIAASAIITHRQVEKASEQEEIASSIAQGANDLSYLSNDYLIYRESQQLTRWQSRLASFSNEVDRLRAEKPEQQALIRNIHANTQRLKEVFESVVSALGSPSQNQPLDSAFLQVSWSRMAVQSRGLVSDATRLAQLLHQRRDQFTITRTVLIYSTVGLFGVFLLASYRLTYRRILKSLATLRAGTAVIGSGNLDFKIVEERNDEIADLSHAFNQMTADLKAVTASKADLEKEVTERKRVDQNLRRQREWLHVTLSSIGDAVIASDTEGRITFLNPEAITLTGWQLEEALGQPIASVFRIVNEMTHMPAEDLLARVLAEKRVVGLTNDTALVAKDGRQVPIEDSAAPIQDSAGNVIGVVLVFHDVTEKRIAQTRLRESEERLRRAQEISHLGSWELDHLGNRLTWSDEVYNIFGIRPQEFGATYEAFLEGVHPDDRAAVDAAYSASVREGRENYEIEHRVIRKSTFEIRTVHERCEHIRDASGRIIRSVGMVHDITDRKRADEALRQRTLELQQLTETLERRVQERTEELAEANKTLRQLSIRLLSAQEEERKRVAGELHDTIGASLSGIKFKVEDTIERIGNKADVEAQSLKTIVPVIQEAVEECRRIQLDLRPSMLDDLGLLPTLSWFSRRFQTIYSRIRVNQKVTIEERDVPDSLKIVIYRVIQEAMNNCAKHSEANRIYLCLQKNGGNMELLLEDDGQGFDLRNALDTESTRRGFGLTSMRERTELSGGSFDIESMVGKGTIIRARWPI
jgi:PAS domain S-box-containing protein